jgi:hypothetical protein
LRLALAWLWGSHGLPYGACPAKKPPTVAAPLVRCSELPMFDGHALALTGWLEADQAELTLLHRPEAEGGFKGHRLPVLRVAPKLGTHGGLWVRARLKAPRGFCGFDDPELRRDGALPIAGLLTPFARATARGSSKWGEAEALADRREWAGSPDRSSEAVVNTPPRATQRRCTCRPASSSISSASRPD